ncbi:hypothetical protein B7494_g4552 [Chlorociboria aeruginascens]|nr:hypothetical protein B7494_g4552 [Chlorociboria aeruginascens]
MPAHKIGVVKSKTRPRKPLTKAKTEANRRILDRKKFNLNTYERVAATGRYEALVGDPTSIVIRITGACRDAGSYKARASYALSFHHDSGHSEAGLIPSLDARHQTVEYAETYAACKSLQTTYRLLLKDPWFRRVVIFTNCQLLVTELCRGIWPYRMADLCFGSTMAGIPRRVPLYGGVVSAELLDCTDLYIRDLQGAGIEVNFQLTGLTGRETNKSTTALANEALKNVQQAWNGVVPRSFTCNGSMDHYLEQFYE